MEILRENKLYALILLVLIGHMFWLKFQFQEIIYIIDYLGRILLIGIACYVFQFKIEQFIDRTKLVTISKFWLVLLSTGLILIFAPFNELFFGLFDPYNNLKWNYFPLTKNLYLKIFDLTVGLILVAVAEGLIFRKLFLEVLTKQRFSNISVYLISSSLFALLHLYQSVQITIGAFIAGLVLMYVYKKSGTLWVPIVSHYLVNLYFFGIRIPFVRTVNVPL